jgi:hypothetical protein
VGDPARLCLTDPPSLPERRRIEDFTSSTPSTATYGPPRRPQGGSVSTPTVRKNRWSIAGARIRTWERVSPPTVSRRYSGGIVASEDGSIGPSLALSRRLHTDVVRRLHRERLYRGPDKRQAKVVQTRAPGSLLVGSEIA